MMSMDINKMYFALALLNIACVCLGFYLGRITQDKARGPALPRVFPEKPAEADQDLYYDAMYGGEEEIIQTVEATK